MNAHRYAALFCACILGWRHFERCDPADWRTCKACELRRWWR